MELYFWFLIYIVAPHQTQLDVLSSPPLILDLSLFVSTLFSYLSYPRTLFFPPLYRTNFSIQDFRNKMFKVLTIRLRGTDREDLSRFPKAFG